MQSTPFIASPLNYTGGKYKLLPQILPLFPKNIDVFVDLFCGGCNVGINVKAKKIIFNDKNNRLINIFYTMQELGFERIFAKLNEAIEFYGLSNVSVNGYEFYGCNSGKGLSNFNKDKFLKLRQDLNSMPDENKDYYILLYLAIVFSFNNQIRFNAKKEFNLPVGKRDFNIRMQKKLKSFCEELQKKNCHFSSIDFEQVLHKLHDNNTFVYADPPYLITCASYNENNSWSAEDDIRLYNHLQRLDKQNIKFALSNIISGNGKVNDILSEWVEDNRYIVHHLNFNYSNSNYHKKIQSNKYDEVLVTNY